MPERKGNLKMDDEHVGKRYCLRCNIIYTAIRRDDQMYCPECAKLYNNMHEDYHMKKRVARDDGPTKWIVEDPGVSGYAKGAVFDDLDFCATLYDSLWHFGMMFKHRNISWTITGPYHVTNEYGGEYWCIDGKALSKAKNGESRPRTTEQRPAHAAV